MKVLNAPLKTVSGLLLFLFWATGLLPAQPPPDTLSVYQMDEIVVVGERVPGPIREAVAAIHVLNREDLQQLPVTTVAEALALVPGLSFLHQDGSGNLAMSVARGFFGGGETEYLLVFVDGVPQNQVATGAVHWGRIPVEQVERIEVLRGNATSLYGDQSLAAVVHIFTRRNDTGSGVSGRLAFGQEGKRALTAGLSWSTASWHGALAGLAEGHRGYRQHSEQKNLLLHGNAQIQKQSAHQWDISFLVQRVRNQYPGPIMEAQAAQDPVQANALFQRDEALQKWGQLSVSYRRKISPRSGWTVRFRTEYGDLERLRTILFTPHWGDSQFSGTRQWRWWTTAVYRQNWKNIALLAGVDAKQSHYRIVYRTPDRLQKLSEGTARRQEAGVFGQLKATLHPRVRGVAGFRYDWLRDNFRSDASGAVVYDRKLTPSFGLNVAYLEAGNLVGHWYGHFSRGFRAPSLAQRFDPRQFPSGVPDQFFQISNARLRPQTASQLETGFYQKFIWPRRKVFGELSLSIYRMDVDDEIDFDLNTFRYGNIQQSRHDGLELYARLHWQSWLRLEGSWTFNRVVFRTGSYAGKQLKLIPGHVSSQRFVLTPTSGLTVSLLRSYQGPAFLDDENSTRLPGYALWDLRIGHRFSTVRFSVLVKNLANRSYNSTGFLLFDPEPQESVSMVYPGRGRFVQASLEMALSLARHQP